MIQERPQPSAVTPNADTGGAQLETCFERLVGRPMGEAERARLYRLRDVLGLRDNDAFWAIVMALEHYDALFREYPAQLARLTERTVENVRTACGAAAHEQVAQVQRMLADKVADTSAMLARKLVDKPFAIHQLTAALAAVVAFGSLCVHAGYELAAPGKPWWVRAPPDPWTPSRALLCLLTVPAGWMVFALMIPVAIHAASFGWRIAADPSALRRDQAVGWCIVACGLLGMFACALVLARIA
jgi:hypothetical protein